MVRLLNFMIEDNRKQDILVDNSPEVEIQRVGSARVISVMSFLYKQYFLLGVQWKKLLPMLYYLQIAV